MFFGAFNQVAFGPRDITLGWFVGQSVFALIAVNTRFNVCLEFDPINFAFLILEYFSDAFNVLAFN
jgi:hypothetical protein